MAKKMADLSCAQIEEEIDRIKKLMSFVNGFLNADPMGRWHALLEDLQNGLDDLYETARAKGC